MKPVLPVTLAAGPVRLVPLTLDHVPGLQAAAADGELWRLRFTSVPAPDETRAYVETALQGQAAGHRLPFAVLHADTGEVLGSTSYHDIVPAIERVEIGWTWYAQRVQRSAVNTTAKLLLLTHAFETLGARLVGWRTDNFNHASQRAIERLGAVGRKTANVVMNVAFGEPTMAVDTHIFRVANRTGLAKGKTPLAVETGTAQDASLPSTCSARPSLADPARPLRLQGTQAPSAGIARWPTCATIVPRRRRRWRARDRRARIPRAGRAGPEPPSGGPPPMLFNPSQEDVRRFFCQTWSQASVPARAADPA